MIAFAAVSLAAGGAFAASPAEDPVQVHCRPRFDVQNWPVLSWVSLEVAASNSGGAASALRFEAGYIRSGASALDRRILAAASMTVPPGGNKRFYLYFPPGDPMRANESIAVNVWRDGVQEGPWNVLQLNHPSSRQGLSILAVGEARAGAKKTFSFMEDYLPGRFEFLEPRNLPDRYPGFEPANVVILHELDPASIPAASRRALRDWVASGGTLVLSPGRDAALFSDGILKELHPFNLVESLPERPVTEFGPPADAAGSHPVQVVHVIEGGSEVAKTADGLPMVSIARSGLGATVALATSMAAARSLDGKSAAAYFGAYVLLADPWATGAFLGRGREMRARVSSQLTAVEPPSSWPAMRSFPLSREQGFFDDDEDSTLIDDFAAGLARGAAGAPNIGFVVFLLLAFIAAVGPLNFLFLRSRKAPALAALTVPLISLAFLAIVVASGLALKGGPRGNRVTVFETAPGQRLAAATSFVFFRSGTGGEYSFSSRDGAALLPNFSDVPYVLDQTGGDVTTVKLDRWVTAVFRSETVEDLGGAVDVELAGGSVTVANGLPFRLSGGMAVAGTPDAEPVGPGVPVTARGFSAPAGEKTRVEAGAGRDTPLSREDRMLLALLYKVSGNGKTPAVGFWVDTSRPGPLLDGAPLKLLEDRTALLMLLR